MNAIDELGNTITLPKGILLITENLPYSKEEWKKRIFAHPLIYVLTQCDGSGGKRTVKRLSAQPIDTSTQKDALMETVMSSYAVFFPSS